MGILTQTRSAGLTGLTETALKLILFGGKGGVGKTTCASGAGLYLAEEGFKVLVISTDPAHSLSDSLDQKFGAEIKEVKGIKNLSVLEVNAQQALSRFKAGNEEQIKRILNTSTYLDRQDINSLFTLPIPGIDELMGFKTIVDLIDEGEFDKYVVDTAPTGHALRLLTLPGLLDEWIKVMSKMRWKYRYMVETFSGKYKEDEGDDFLLLMKKMVKRIEGLLKDQNRCEFIAVTIPEAMAIMETERLVSELKNYGIKVKQLVVNNVLEAGDCGFCRERSRAQREYLKRLESGFGALRAVTLPLWPREIRGLESLNNLKERLF